MQQLIDKLIISKQCSLLTFNGKHGIISLIWKNILMGFADQVNKACNNILKAVEVKCYSITYMLFIGIIKDTPVLKGDLINNWFPSIGNKYSSATTLAHDKSGSGSVSMVAEVVNHTLFYGKDAVATMTNNLKYAVRAEKLGWPKEDGWSGRVGPYLMRHKNLIKIKLQYN